MIKILFSAVEILRRLSPLWRGLRRHTTDYLSGFGMIKTPKTIPVMEGVETRKLPFVLSRGNLTPKTIPVMEGVETFICALSPA